MPSQAVIVGDSVFREGRGALQGYESFRESALLYDELLNNLDPFKGNCTLIPGRDTSAPGVDADTVMDAISDAVKKASAPEDTLLVVYIGHGIAWDDLHNGEVHLAMYGSRDGRPWSWLPYSSIRREMMRKHDGLRIVIADCCYSNFLHRQGGSVDDAPENSFAALDKANGTAVFTAVDPEGRDPKAWPKGCEKLSERMRRCTHFSGHFLQVLSDGSKTAGERLSLGDMRDGVVDEMRACKTPHPVGGLILRGLGDSVPFVQNALPDDKPRELPPRSTDEDWIRALRTGRRWPIKSLLEKPDQAGRVSLSLWTIPEAHENASRIDREANDAYRRDPGKYAMYWYVRDGLAA
ncbi:MAG: hypothetical protein HOW97_00220 [Catenulispora sp.]|nr:hypothetical protein [Catenulispora sp.]